VRVLLVRAGALGDVVLLRGAIASLHAAGHESVLLAPPGPGSAVVGPGPSEVGEVLSWDDPGFARWLADSGAPPPFGGALSSFQAALAFTRDNDVVARLLEVVPRVVMRDPAPRPLAGHASLWLAEATREVGAVSVPLPPDLVATEAERASALPVLARLPPRFLAIHPGSGSPGKNWPAARFAEVARALSPGRPWLLVVGPADEDAAAALGTPSPDVVVARSLPPRVLGAVLREAGGYVGNDSGVSHLAAAFGAPVLALFGPSDPAVWAPLGRRVQVLRAPDQSLAALSVEEVVARARAMR
jgi:ADP-heptose:LPS heptosyltransferase